VGEVISVKENAKKKNEEAAAKNRELFCSKGWRVLNLISSPGSGKTALLEALGRRWGKKLAVLTADIQTTQDADRIIHAGAKALQIETGGTCHLTAMVVSDHLAKLDMNGVDYLVIENIGNLICPAGYDLGESAKVALLSVAEGDEKPSKYPGLFLRAEAVVITKMDLLPYVNFDIERAERDCRKLNPNVRFFRLSVKTGEGVEEFAKYVEGLSAKKS
jgi:hydrogenase nickel incorporation protein HypB